MTDNPAPSKGLSQRGHAPALSFEQKLQLADSFARSNLFGVKNQDQALALMALCEAEGLHPANAVREYEIIDGKPSLRADAMLARFQAAGGRVRWLEMSDERVVGEFSHPSGGTVTIDWDMARATRAGLTNKNNWQKYQRAMLRSRVASEGVRAVYPGVVVGVYTPEEVQDFDDEPPREPKDITPPKKLEYTDEEFKEKLQVWHDLIHSQNKSPEAIINTVSTRYELTEEQKRKIRNLVHDTDENDPDKFFGEENEDS